MKRFAFLAIPFVFAACGDNKAVEQPIDAPPVDIDAQNIDAPPPIDAREIDAPPAVTYSGTVSLLEAALLNPTGAPTTYFGQGVQIGISFTASDQVPAPVMEEQPGSPLGCKVWVMDRTQAIASSVGVNEGPIQINSPAGTTANPPYPPCTFGATGYSCPELTTASSGGTIAGVPAGPLMGFPSLTDLDVMYSMGNSANRWVSITGATNADNNGVFPILAVGGANTIVYANPRFVAEMIPATGSLHVNVAGVGPTPAAVAPDPGFLLDTASVDFVHTTTGGGNHIGAFTSTTTAGGSVGDDFELAPASRTLMNALPRDGSAFTIACDSASCAAGSGSGSLINIVTTNGTPAAGNPFDMPLPNDQTANPTGPVGRRVQIRCAALGATSITVPAAYAAFLTPAMTNMATRIQSTFIRPTLMGGGVSNVTSISGHAIVGFTN